MKYFFPSAVPFDGTDNYYSDTDDIEKVEGEIDSSYIYGLLSEEQKWVASLLSQGFGRVEIANAMGISVVTVHKIILLIRLRLSPPYQTQIVRRERNLYQNLLFLFLLSSPESTPVFIYRIWKSHPVLKEYRKPDIYLLRQWYNLIKNGTL